MNKLDIKSKRYCTLLSLTLILLVMMIALSGYLYKLSHDKIQLGLLKDFIMAEFQYVYPEHEELVTICEDSESIPELISAWKSDRFDLMFLEHEWSHVSVEEAMDIHEKLLPEDIYVANDYIMPFIYSNAILDVRTIMDREDEMYYETSTGLLELLRIHEPLQLISKTGFLYAHMNNILLCVQVLLVLCVSLHIFSIIKLSKLNKNMFLDGGEK